MTVNPISCGFRQSSFIAEEPSRIRSAVVNMSLPRYGSAVAYFLLGALERISS